MTDKIVNRANLQDVRKQCSEYATENSDRIDLIVSYLQLVPNILVFDINGGVDYPLPNVTDDPVPLTQEVASGLNPPTIAGSVITIHAAGIYDASASFGMDTGSAGNIVSVAARVNGVPAGLVAGIRQAGGQGGLAVQPTAAVMFDAEVGDEIDFVATSTDLGAELIAPISGGSCSQISHDFTPDNP
jgi:hypothetical protein